MIECPIVENTDEMTVEEFRSREQRLSVAWRSSFVRMVDEQSLIRIGQAQPYVVLVDKMIVAVKLV